MAMVANKKADLWCLWAVPIDSKHTEASFLQIQLISYAYTGCSGA